MALKIRNEDAGRVSDWRPRQAITRCGVRLVACDCRYDMSKARGELGYRPQVSFCAGVRELARAGTDVVPAAAGYSDA
ncbi:MAG TPA: hypothetical protein VGK32_20980 [Vicinamibacterales bacterium]|jgi:nucleoside-diphosphate-sugar epimerase